VLPSHYVNGQAFRVPFTMEGQLTGFMRCPEGFFLAASQPVWYLVKWLGKRHFDYSAIWYVRSATPSLPFQSQPP